MATHVERTDRCSTPGGRGVLTVDQVARILRISTYHVDRLVHSRQLLHTEVWHTIGIPAGAVCALVTRHGHGPIPWNSAADVPNHMRHWHTADITHLADTPPSLAT